MAVPVGSRALCIVCLVLQACQYVAGMSLRNQAPTHRTPAKVGKPMHTALHSKVVEEREPTPKTFNHDPDEDAAQTLKNTMVAASNALDTESETDADDEAVHDGNPMSGNVSFRTAGNTEENSSKEDEELQGDNASFVADSERHADEDEDDDEYDDEGNASSGNMSASAKADSDADADDDDEEVRTDNAAFRSVKGTATAETHTNGEKVNDGKDAVKTSAGHVTTAASANVIKDADKKKISTRSGNASSAAEVADKGANVHAAGENATQEDAELAIPSDDTLVELNAALASS